MPSHSGPNSSAESNLVFGYDLGNRSVSYKGEPTVNLIPNPSINSRFAAGNGWRTYNTAQYNSNTYFSIGTIESVIDNVVTLATIDRPIYTFDVLRAQTSGGGITAGTNYFIKKLSDNQFTLHEYNGSQDGTQGYINPDTRMHKVHDSIAFDERIPVSFNEFPTVWWGPPHTPNMCYVKELRSQGGPNDDSSFMRIHMTRTEQMNGGMAYGVYPQVTQGDIVTLSFWARASIVRDWSWSAYFGGGFQGASGTINATTEWQRFEYTWTASNTFGFYIYFWPGNPGIVPYYVDIADIQAEVNKGHATTFTLSERTVTDSLLDLTGNNTIDLSNVSFDSNELITFDGTNDFINTGINSPKWAAETFTIEGWVKYDNINGDDGWFELQSNGIEFGLSTVVRSGKFYFYWIGHGSNAGYNVSSSAFVSNSWIHITITHQGTDSTTNTDVFNNTTVYVNGELIPHSSAGSAGVSGGGNLLVGSQQYSFAGDINLFKYYNRILTADEIAANYNSTKSRFQ